MEQEGIIRIKQQLLVKEPEHLELARRLKSKKTLKTYSIILIPVLIFAGVVAVSIEEPVPGHTYLTSSPYAALAIPLLFLAVVSAFLSVLFFFEERKLRPIVDENFKSVIALKNELIILENTRQ